MRTKRNIHVTSYAMKGKDDYYMKNNNNCLIHSKANHLTRKCKDFLAKTAIERGQLIKDLDACKLCLSLSHVGMPCPWEAKWNPCNVSGCQEYHSRLVHGCNIQGVSYHIKTSNSGVNQETDPNTLLLIQNVRSVREKILIFWDNGSTISLVSKGYVMRNRLKGVRVPYELVTVGNIVQPQNTMMHEVPIIDRKGDVHIIKAYEINEICSNIESTDMTGIVDLFTALKIDEVTRPTGEVDLLIGINFAQLHPNAIKKRKTLCFMKASLGQGSCWEVNTEILFARIE